MWLWPRRKRPNANLIAETLRLRLQEAEDSLRSGDRSISKERAEELEGLETLLEMRYRYALLKVRRWGVFGGLLLVSLILVWLTVHEKETLFTARVRTSSLHLRRPGTIQFESPKAAAARMSGLLRTPIPKTRLGAAAAESLRTDVYLQSASTEVQVSDGPLLLQSVELPTQAELSLLYDRPGRRLQLHVECPAAERCKAGRFTLVKLPAAVSARGQLSGATPLELWFANGSSDLSVNLTGAFPISLLRDLDIESIAFLDVRDAAVGQLGPTLAWSGVLGGEVKLGAIGRNVTVEPGEWLRVAGPQLRLTNLVVEDSALSLTLRGHASRLEIASSGTRRNLKPTWMELLISREGGLLTVGWGLLVAIGLFLARALAAYWGRL